jgi:hypothetical protein
MAKDRIALRLQRASLHLKQKQKTALNIQIPAKAQDSAGLAYYITVSPPKDERVSFQENPPVAINHSVFDVDQGDWVDSPIAQYAAPSIPEEDNGSDE